MKLILKLFSIVFLIFVFTTSQAQISDAKPNDKVEIILKDGNRVVGQIKSINETEFIIISESLGELTIKKENISQVTFLKFQKEIIPDKNGIRTDFHNSTHYFVFPSAYTLKTGQKYYENIGIFFNTFSFGVTDNFSISIGGEIASLLFVSNFPALYISSRFSVPFPDETGAFGAGFVLFTSPEDEFEGFGVAQANITIGGRNNNFTAGIGFGFSLREGFSDEVLPLQLSYMGRISDKISFVTDNFLIFNNDFLDNFGIISAGLRIHFKKNGGAFNVALWRTTEDQGELIAFPFVSATIPLGDY